MDATRKLTALTALLLFGFVARARDDKTWRIADAYRAHASHVTVVGSGTVTKLLRDDTNGARHQRFLLEVEGLSVLVAHNIDLARRVDPLRKGNTIEFRGEYIWNEKGGILHWTHHDPSGRHSPGWLKRNNVTFD
jgi:hypothetical protein